MDMSVGSSSFLILSVFCSSLSLAVPFTEGDSGEFLFNMESFAPGRKGAGKKSLQRATLFNDDAIMPLEFWDKVKKKPRGKHLKPARLLRKMGDDFTPEWMSMERPSAGDGRYALPEEQVAALMEQVADLDIETDIKEMLGVDNLRHEPTVNRAVGAFQQWLVKKSSCPVSFQWTDLGEYFWPRYIRQGKCKGGKKGLSGGVAREGRSIDGQDEENDIGGSCSWPRGMKCNPADAEVLQILRWHCKRRGSPDLLGLTTRQKIRKSYKCRWIKVPYPVTSTCRCGS